MDSTNTVNISKIEEIVNRTVIYLKEWTQKEFLELVNHPLHKDQAPLIVDMGGKGYLIGNYAVRPMKGNWWNVSYCYSDTEYIFSSKIAAVCYAVYKQSGKTNLAEKILKQDEDVGRLIVKTDQYKYNYKQAKNKKNNFAADVFLSRYHNYLTQLEQSKNDLGKSLKLAKYFNLWE